MEWQIRVTSIRFLSRRGTPYVPTVILPFRMQTLAFLVAPGRALKIAVVPKPGDPVVVEFVCEGRGRCRVDAELDPQRKKR